MEADIIVSCPYNPAHRIRKYKLMNHITKCKKTSKLDNKAECPLDKSHIVDRDHLKVGLDLYVYGLYMYAYKYKTVSEFTFVKHIVWFLCVGRSNFFLWQNCVTLYIQIYCNKFMFQICSFERSSCY